MRGFALWIAGAVVLSGCSAEPPTDPAHPPGANEGAGADAPHPGFEGPWVAGKYANQQREAFVAVSLDGRTILTCAHGYFTHAAYMYASTDAGATWRTLTATPDPAVSGDCEVAISPKGVWAFLHSTVVGATVATTPDQGMTWAVNAASAVPIGGGADRPYLEFLQERLLLSMQPGPGEPGGIGVTYSDDYATTWSTPVVVSRLQPTAPHPRSGGFVLGPDGKTVRVPLSAAVELAGELAGQGSVSTFAVSRDRGTTWSTENVATPSVPQQFPAAAQDGLGNLYWFYMTAGGRGADLMSVISRDDGRTWSRPVPIGQDNFWPRPWAHGRADGTADVLWQHATNGTGELRLARLDADGAVVLDATVRDLPESLEYAEVAHDGAGRAHIASSAREKDPSEVWIFRERP